MKSPNVTALLKFSTFLSIITHIPEDHQWVFERECDQFRLLKCPTDFRANTGMPFPLGCVYLRFRKRKRRLLDTEGQKNNTVGLLYFANSSSKHVRHQTRYKLHLSICTISNFLLTNWNKERRNEEWLTCNVTRMQQLLEVTELKLPISELPLFYP